MELMSTVISCQFWWPYRQSDSRLRSLECRMSCSIFCKPQIPRDKWGTCLTSPVTNWIARFFPSAKWGSKNTANVSYGNARKRGCFLGVKSGCFCSWAFSLTYFGFFIGNEVKNMLKLEWEIWVSTESDTESFPVSFNLIKPLLLQTTSSYRE